MRPPDLVGCPEHGLADMVDHPNRRDRSVGWHCNACRRERDSPRHYNGPRCYKRGHLKTPWTWVRYGGVYRCLPCANLTRKVQRDVVREARAQEEVAA